MHVLTKIFIVLVTVLAIMLVPLVVVYAHNENAYQAKYQSAELKAAGARDALSSAQASHGAQVRRLEGEIQALNSENVELRRTTDQQESEIRTAQARLAEAELMDEQIRTQLATLAIAGENNSKLATSLIDEVRDLRRVSLTTEREKVELDAALRERQALLDAAVEARKAIQEELERLKDEYAAAIGNLQSYVAVHGPLDSNRVAAGDRGPVVDKSLDGYVVNVRRSADQNLAEIDAGSRDGVREGWVMTIARGGDFIARLRIIEVDINRSTGIIELEDEFTRGRVQEGDRVMARPNR